MKELAEIILGASAAVVLLVFALANFVAFMIGVDIGVDDNRICKTNWSKYTAAKLSCYLSKQLGKLK